MDNNMLFRTVLIVLAAFVLFALINYYNNKQSTMKSEKFFNVNSNKSKETFDDLINTQYAMNPVDNIKKETNAVVPA